MFVNREKKKIKRERERESESLRVFIALVDGSKNIWIIIRFEAVVL